MLPTGRGKAAGVIFFVNSAALGAHLSWRDGRLA
jgi:hypothetical protein